MEPPSPHAIVDEDPSDERKSATSTHAKLLEVLHARGAVEGTVDLSKDTATKLFKAGTIVHEVRKLKRMGECGTHQHLAQHCFGGPAGSDGMPLSNHRSFLTTPLTNAPH
jgi:hypothetical protein